MVSGHRMIVPRQPPGRTEFDPAEDHRQLGCGDRHLDSVGGRESERALLQAADVEGEPVPLPGQDLQPVPALVAEHVQIARQRVLAQVGGHGRLQPVEALPPILRASADPDPAGQPEGQHVPPRRATTSRATAPASAPTGARRTSPPGTTIAIIGSGITRTAANEGLAVAAAAAFGGCSRRASSRRLAKKVDSPIPRAAQNAVTVWPDSFQAVMVSRQNWSLAARRRRVFGIGRASSRVSKLRSYPTPQGVPRPDVYRKPGARE